MESLTLWALVAEMAPLAGQPVREIRPGGPGELGLTIGNSARLVIDPSGQRAALRLEEDLEGGGRGPGRKSKAAAFEWPGDAAWSEIAWHLGTRAAGGRLTRLWMPGAGRVVGIAIARKDRYGDEAATSLAIEVYGAFVNIILVEGELPGGRILARFRDDRRAAAGARLERGRPYEWPARGRVDPVDGQVERLALRLDETPRPADDVAWAERLAGVAEGFSPVTARLAVARADHPVTAEGLARTAARLFDEAVTRPEPGVLVPSAGRPRALPIRPPAGAGVWQPAASVAGAVNLESGAARNATHPHEPPTAPKPHQRLRDRLSSRLVVHTRRLTRLRAELNRHPDEETPRRRAETLLAAADRVPRGAGSVELDPPDGGPAVTIPLDPARSAIENAERYFREARKARQSRERLPGEIGRAEREVARLENWLGRLDGLDPADADGFARLAFEIDGRPRPDGRAGRGSADPDSGEAVRSPSAGGGVRGAKAVPGSWQPRRYDLPNGWHVLVGRSEAGNDYLTHRLAEPHDLWFHAHGCPGSHVVLRGPGRQALPDRSTIEAAAGLAALHSKARHAARVPVIYAEKRHVRKPRGSKPGLAAVTHEKSIMVRPAEPGPAREDS